MESTFGTYELRHMILLFGLPQVCKHLGIPEQKDRPWLVAEIEALIGSEAFDQAQARRVYDFTCILLRVNTCREVDIYLRTDNQALQGLTPSQVVRLGILDGVDLVAHGTWIRLSCFVAEVESFMDRLTSLQLPDQATIDRLIDSAHLQQHLRNECYDQLRARGVADVPENGTLDYNGMRRALFDEPRTNALVQAKAKLAAFIAVSVVGAAASTQQSQVAIEAAG